MVVKAIIQHEGSKSLTKIYNNRRWGDLKIINKDKSYAVHKDILASSIPYFEKMFTIDMKESKSTEISLDHPTEPFEMVIDWAYCQPVTIKTDNARQLFDLADYMSIPELTVECLAFLFDHSSDSVLTEVSHWIDQIATDEARKMLERYICLHFCDLITTQEFLNYDVHTVNYIFSLDNLNIENEIEVCDAIIEWTDANSQERLGHLSKLLRQVHWSSIDCHQFIDNVAKNHLVMMCNDTRSMMKTVFDCMLYNESDESKKLNLIYQPRTKSSADQCLYVLSRSSDHIKVTHVDLNNLNKQFLQLSIENYLSPPKFFDSHLCQYIFNSSQIIRIDWERKRFYIRKSYLHLFSLLFGHAFVFETKMNGEVQFWKRSRYIKLAPIPDYCSLPIAVYPYKGQFFIVGYPAVNPKSSLMILEFDPIENIWSDTSTASYPVPQNSNVKMTIYQDKIFIFLERGKYWIYDLDEDTWSCHSAKSNEITWSSVSDLSIVLHDSKIIQCFKNSENCILREVSFIKDELVKSKEQTISDPNHEIFAIISSSLFQ